MPDGFTTPDLIALVGRFFNLSSEEGGR